MLSTGAGVEHSEIATDDGPCRFVQVWLRAESAGDPSYSVRPVGDRVNEPLPVAQPRPDAVLWSLHLDGTTPVDLPEGDRVHAYVATGALLRSSLAEPLATGDAFEITDEPMHASPPAYRRPARVDVPRRTRPGAAGLEARSLDGLRTGRRRRER